MKCYNNSLLSEVSYLIPRKRLPPNQWRIPRFQTYTDPVSWRPFNDVTGMTSTTFNMVLLCWEYIVFLQQLQKCFKYPDIVYLRHWMICSISSYYSPVKHLIHLIYLNLYEHRAWSLNISTAAQLNSGLERLLTSFTEIHLQ